ncbi:hypothetical protein TorRG33x02_321320 [Trema orientale]|uniref:Uncharacterized protein n=1 Tax=Trema orientale TaxID=63057 RepID=A0A2P5BGZ2_TREOI|nr:hypothetical protein TorRG33x02_321320 [Trema orientale]
MFHGHKLNPPCSQSDDRWWRSSEIEISCHALLDYIEAVEVWRFKYIDDLRKMWFIWFERNSLIHEGKRRNPNDVFCKDVEYWKEIGMGVPPKSSNGNRISSWQLLENDMMIC